MHEATLSVAGIGRLAQISIQSNLDDGSLVRVLPDWSLGELPINALFPARKSIPAKARVFVDFVRGIVKANLGGSARKTQARPRP